MAYTSPRISKTGAREPWKPRGARGVPFISWFTFSAKSPFTYDNWGRDIKRPYQLVLFPGYKPKKIEGRLRNDCDYVWYERPVSKPTIVWDGFDPYSLMEVAYEAFQVEKLGVVARIRDVESGKWIDDPRSPELLAKRPKRTFSLPDPAVDPGKYQLANREHRRALARWTYESMTAANRACAASERNAAYDPEVKAWSYLNGIYSAALNPKSGSHPDNMARDTHAAKRLRSDPGKAFMDPPGYKSPLKFMEKEIENRSHRVFEAESKAVKAIAEERSVKRQRAIESIPDAVVLKTGSFWGRLFSRAC